MKKLIYFVFFLVTLIPNTVAQDVRFGFKAGVNISNVASDSFENEPLTSFHVGGVMEALFSEKIALQPEILYSSQGFKTDEANEQTTYKLTYINMPVMVRYFVSKGIYLEAGPQMGFLNTAKIVSEADGSSDSEDIKEGLRSNDFNLNLGVGFQLPNGFSINARYNYGFSNIVNRLSDDNLKNRVIQFSVEYLF